MFFANTIPCLRREDTADRIEAVAKFLNVSFSEALLFVARNGFPEHLQCDDNALKRKYEAVKVVPSHKKRKFAAT
jgi:hypothetical protein